MNSTLARLSVARGGPRAAVRSAARPDLAWTHDGVRHRVTTWPEVRFERETDAGSWEALEGDETAFASASLGVTATLWRRYLEFVPATERAFLEQFQFSRMEAWLVIVRCPELLTDLADVPALTPF